MSTYRQNNSIQARDSLLKHLKQLWKHISQRRRIQFGLLLMLMLLTSFAEIFSIGLVLPFLGALTAPDHIFKLTMTQPIINALGLSSSSQLLFPLTILFCAAAIFFWCHTFIASLS